MEKAGREILLSVVGSSTLPLVAIVTAPILAHSLGVVGRGEVATATAPYQLMAVVAALGLPDAVTHYVAKRVSNARRIVWQACGISLALGLASMLGIWLLADVLAGGSPEVRALVLCAALALPFTLVVGVLRGTAQGLERWDLVALEQTTFAVVRVVAIMTLFLGNWLTPLSATLVFAWSPVAGAACYWPLLRGRLRSKAVHPPQRLRAVSTFGLRTWGGAISGVLLYRLDQALMTPLSSTEQLGLYVSAVQLGELPWIITMAVKNVTFARESRNASLVDLTALSRASLLVCLLVSLLLGLTTEWLIPILFGSEFLAAAPAAWVLLVAAAIAVPGSVAGSGLAARGRPGLVSLSLTAACVVNVVLIFVLVPRWAALGGALAACGGQITIVVLNLAFMRLYFHAPAHQFFRLRRSDAAAVVRYSRRGWNSSWRRVARRS